MKTKLTESVKQAIVNSGLRSGMTISFHHHLRNGDYVVNMVMKAAIEELGLKDLTIAATSLGEAHDPIAEYIEEGKVVGIQTSGIRGRMGQVVSEGKLKTPAIIRSHGGRPRAIEAGEVHIDIAFVAAPTSDAITAIIARERRRGQLPRHRRQEQLRLDGLRHDGRQIRGSRGCRHRLSGGFPEHAGLCRGD